MRIRLPLAASTLVALVVAAGSVLGASPSPSPSSSPAPSAEPSFVIQPEPAIEIWFDEPRPDPWPAGQDVTIGFVLWDARQFTLIREATPYIRLRTPDEPPGRHDVIAREDTPGHFTATLAVPEAGAPQLEVGFLGFTCDPPGDCHEVELVFAEGGVGPPPNARPTSLLRAAIAAMPTTIRATEPVDVRVELAPVGPWAPAGLDLPNRLFLLERLTRDTDRATELRVSPTDPTAYLGRLTLPDPGQAELTIGLEATRSAATVFADSTMEVTVGPAPTGIGGEADGSLPVVPIGLGLAAIVLVSLLARRFLADL